MTSLSTVFTAILYVFIIDFLARQILKTSAYRPYFKPPGLIASFIICLFKGTTLLSNKDATLVRFFMSLVTLAIMFFMLLNIISNTQNSFNIFAIPVIAMPFYHLIFGYLTRDSTTIIATLNFFRLRAMLSLLLLANIIFLKLEPKFSLIGLLAHSTLAFLALVYFFYLCSCQRQPPSPNNFAKLEDWDCGPSAFLHYLVSCAEVCFYVVLFYQSFIQPQLENDLAIFGISVFILASAGITKLFFYLGSPWTSKLLEEKLLPLSFFVFGTASLLQIYF